MLSDCFMCGGREFQSLGAEQLNDRAPIEVSRDVGTGALPGILGPMKDSNFGPPPTSIDCFGKHGPASQ